VSTKSENLGHPGSCLNRAQFDEHIFVLKSTDVDAPVVIRLWAAMYMARKKRAKEWNLTAKQKHTDALACAASMEKWRKNHE
jgi:hypothetical protein